mmetsp:Transcript_17188/g.44787  ORF Transcript_17188/g.44787 Transcript_17188/m.44787 type:complete len:375 (-) Transcript_17188:261-1385(-)|eukprot:CAMPEP_0182918604 /NCGR_PEP_ID=MMETSP0105_2-20130417/2199_1 /TAXON_ID=81532 ORGANISM="Acanthoeca-like sp., Strain 10tr" /NCGR_SAMPLE_ID=MMETSP0105_2 /ASSEMBLY_ACC=CAM_ASM_000205 /LENGTH=374 /DNA_ID=CAMNT_0025055711 /DNA_START=127 /DNA_END=1251 /DNA_ORIENTATION=+
MTRWDRFCGALWGLFAGDALAMPAHWYYDLGRLGRDFGKIEGYVTPKEKLPGSILSLSSTSGGGRGGFDGQLIGDVINHGKRKYWGRGLNYFYHCTLQKGENTLEGQIARLAMRSLAQSGGTFVAKPFVSDFVSFMTTPGSHNDTYASTYVRMFFENYAKGTPPDLCPGNDGHNVDTMDALTVCGVVAVSSWGRGDDVATASAAVSEFLQSLRRSSKLPSFGRVYTELLYDILNAPADANPADTIRKGAAKMGAQVGLKVESMAARYPGDSNPMTACYIDSAIPAMLIILYKYADDPAACLLASTNAGGENVARTSVLGTIVGAAYGKESLPPWLEEGLYNTKDIKGEVDALLVAVQGAAADLAAPGADGCEAK